MEYSAKKTDLADILSWRDMYRLEMGCQIIHDSIHSRRGWTDEYVLVADGAAVGCGSIAVSGPWSGNPTVYEFYVVPHHRLDVLDLFRALVTLSGAGRIVAQSNDSLLTAMLHAFAQDVTSDKMLFHDKLTTLHSPSGAVFRLPTSAEASDIPTDQLKWRGVVEVEGKVAATGGILFHYNPPHGDVYMEVAEPLRRRGLGSFLVQELKRVCYEGGIVPAARCDTGNVASRRTLQRAGFVPCGHILNGSVVRVQNSSAL
jgi:GNAT superfamily N-acetyltransferase